jgi:hypothetical protein
MIDLDKAVADLTALRQGMDRISWTDPELRREWRALKSKLGFLLTGLQMCQRFPKDEGAYNLRTSYSTAYLILDKLAAMTLLEAQPSLKPIVAFRRLVPAEHRPLYRRFKRMIQDILRGEFKDMKGRVVVALQLNPSPYTGASCFTHLSSLTHVILINPTVTFTAKGLRETARHELLHAWGSERNGYHSFGDYDRRFIREARRRGIIQNDHSAYNAEMARLRARKGEIQTRLARLQKERQ